LTVLGIISLAGAMLLLAIIPGPGVFATVARALASGFKHASVVIAGIVLGDLVFLFLAIYGLSAMATILGDLFALVRYAGGAYLIWLGYKLWAVKPRPESIEGVEELSWKSNFATGLAITLGNPKVILFYLGFLPTFVDLNALSGFDVTIIALVVSMVLASVMLGYAYAAVRARQLFNSEKAEKNMNRAAAGVMITTGSILIAKT